MSDVGTSVGTMSERATSTAHGCECIFLQIVMFRARFTHARAYYYMFAHAKQRCGYLVGIWLRIECLLLFAVQKCKETVITISETPDSHSRLFKTPWSQPHSLPLEVLWRLEDLRVKSWIREYEVSEEECAWALPLSFAAQPSIHQRWKLSRPPS